MKVRTWKASAVDDRGLFDFPRHRLEAVANDVEAEGDLIVVWTIARPIACLSDAIGRT
jgi:hypothetical protein